MSMKSLANLVCESSVRTSEKVLSKELLRSLPELSKGVLAYGVNSTEKTALVPAPSEKKLGSFVLELAQFLNVENEKAKLILSNYLAGDFRGTPDSLKRLASEERFRKPLLRDIWHFYRAERLYLLQVLKAIFSNARNTLHNRNDIFEEVFCRLLKGDSLKGSLISQLKSTLNEEPPTRETHGKSFNDDMATSWVHINLREIAEILQLMILYFYNMEGVEGENLATSEEFLDLVKLFQASGFTKKAVLPTKSVEIDRELCEAIGFFQSLLLVLLMDLPRITSEEINPLMKCSADIDRVIAGLGNKGDHGPVMLSWMLAHFLAGDDLARYRILGERAVHLKVLQTLSKSLTNTVVCANESVSAVLHSTIFAVTSVLVSAFDPSRLNIDTDLHVLLCTLFKDNNVANTFWKTCKSSEIGTIFGSKLSRFPAEMSDAMEMLEALAMASLQSGEEVFACLQNLDLFAEHVQNVPPMCLKHLSGNQIETVSSRQIGSLLVPKGTKVHLDQKLYLFNLKFSGMKCLFDEMEKLSKQASQGASHLNQTTLLNVVKIARLFEVLLRNSASCFQSCSHQISKSCQYLVERVVRLPTPPINLLSSCLQSLTLVAQQKPHTIWERLAETGIFPYLANGFGSTEDDLDINPGFVGGLLAQYECVQGLYPLTMSFLDLLLTCVTLDTANLVRPSIIYVIQDIFPSYRQWRFEIPKEREIFGQKLLRVIKRVIVMNRSEELQNLGIRTLLSPAPNHTLLAIASTGDKYIQSLYQSQSSMEGGIGVELSRCVHLSLTILNTLLQKTGIENIASLKKVICSPPVGSRPHFLLTMAHYLYHSRSFDLPLAAVNLLSTVATILPMSLLACLGSDAEAIRDILIHRLEAQTVDVLLKIGIIKLFSACVGSQPGFIQLLIGAKTSVKDSEIGLSGADKDSSEVDLVDSRGCLSTVLELLAEVTEKPDAQNFELHLTLVEFIYSLCENQRIVALSYLKKQDKFWEKLTQPLFSSSTTSRPKLIGCILRILSSEVYTYKGEVDKELKTIFEKLFDDDSQKMSEWCQDKLFKTAQTMEIDDTLLTTDEREEDNKAGVAFLLSSWKSFMLVVAHDHPISVSPKQSQKIVSALIKAVRDQISLSVPDMEVTTAFSETCLVLIQKWQTKCAEKMEIFINNQCDLLNELSLAFEQLNSRTRSAILGIASIALKFSSFMMDNKEEILYSWLRPMVLLVEKSLVHFLTSPTPEGNNTLIVGLCLMQNLLLRFKNPDRWLNALHERSTIQSLLSAVHHSIRSRKQDDVAAHCLGLLVLIAQTSTGTDALLGGCDLSQMLWLPLSYMEATSLKEKWRSVFLLSVHLSIILQKNGKHRALESSISIITLLQNHLTGTLLSLREAIQSGKLDLIVSTATLVSDLMSYHKQLQIHYQSSLVHFYRIICGVVHQSICLLIRPSYLSILFNRKDKQNGHESIESNFSRRRLSSTADTHDGLSESSTPEITNIQNQLLEIVSIGLSMLLALSPDLTSLVTDDISDCAAFYQLLHVGFATPAFEQDESTGLSYGTVISISNLCTRSMTKSTDLPSSPSRGGSTLRSDSPSLDRRKAIMVLEKSLTLVLSQSLLFLSDTKFSPRDKQLLRRELGAELESVVESMRRYSHRGTKSPHPDLAGSTSSTRLPKLDEKFMKFVTAIVQKAFK